MSATVRRVGPSGWAALQAQLEVLAGVTLRVGSMGPGGGPAPRYRPQPGESDPDVDVATMLAWHEFGLVPNVPARPFMRSWSAINRRRIQDIMRRIAREAARGRDAAQQADRDGALLAGSLRRHLLEGITPNLAPSTLERVLPRTEPLATRQIVDTLRHHVDRK